MKKFLSIFFLCFSVHLIAQKSIPKPNPPRLVVDNAGVLNDYDERLLERKLESLDDSSSNQIAVVIVNSLNDQPIEDVATATFRDWGIGNKKTNNGVLILIAVQDRKIRIEVGYGLEGAIPDIVANDIIQKDIKPAFRQGNYIGGLNTAIDDLSKAAVGEYKVQREHKERGNSKGSGILFVIIVFVVIMIVARGGRGGGNSSGGDWITPMIIGSMIGRSGRGGGWSSGGGDWGGGGFGGFGGGSSGGGGASGSW